MLRAAVVVLVLACALAPEWEGASGAAPARFRIRIDSSVWWPGQDFWDRMGGVVPPKRRALPAPAPLGGGPVDIFFERAPLGDALAALGRAARLRIALDPAVEPTAVSIRADGLSFEDALDLVLAHADGAVAYRVEEDTIRVWPR